MPCEHRASRSPRAVTDETENRSTSSRTVICPFCSISSRILRRRCSAKRRESLLVVIRVGSLAGEYIPLGLHPRILYAAFMENKRKRRTIGHFSSELT